MVNATAYDGRPDLEGEHQGLVEAVAERLWRKRTHYFRPGQDWKGQSVAVKTSWRTTAHETLQFLLDRGFVGPGGHPTGSTEGMDYGWGFDANDWVIYDGDKGCVALVGDARDVPMFLAAPKMRDAIHNLLEALGDNPASSMPEIAALKEALPEL